MTAWGVERDWKVYCRAILGFYNHLIYEYSNKPKPKGKKYWETLQLDQAAAQWCMWYRKIKSSSKCWHLLYSQNLLYRERDTVINNTSNV